MRLAREPDNPYDGNAVAVYAARGRKVVGYVQRGRAASIARRLDAGETLVAVCMWGPGPGSDTGTCFVVIGGESDLEALCADL